MMGGGTSRITQKIHLKNIGRRYENENMSLVNKRGIHVLRDNTLNKGTGFPEHERDSFALRGLIPPRCQSLDEQVQGVLERLNNLRKSGVSPLIVWKELQRVRNRNYTLFMKLLSENLIEYSAIVYTPTIGEVCQNWHDLWITSRELYVTIEDVECGRTMSVIDNWPYDQVDLVVVTDGSRILGLGDLGINGAGISIGKIELYIAGAGIDPRRVMPVCLDCGTNNESLLNEPNYFGLLRKRASDEETYQVVDDFVRCIRVRYPRALIHFEDFATQKARDILQKYRKRKEFVFNDDIQGTGCVGLAAILAYVKARSLVETCDLRDLNFVICGAGSSAIGIVDMVKAKMIELGVSEKEALKHFWILDSKGLIGGSEVYSDSVKESFRRSDRERGVSLLECIRDAKPEVLIGCSGVPNVFTSEVLREMGNFCEKPLIMPLSNPTSNAECTAEEAFVNTKGRCYFASGSPFPDFEFQEKTLKTNQCNNVYIFPAVGFASILCEAREITDRMLAASAEALCNSLSEEDLRKGVLFPPVRGLREISRNVAFSVIRAAEEEGVCKKMDLKSSTDLKRHMWIPEYRQLIQSPEYP